MSVDRTVYKQKQFPFAIMDVNSSRLCRLCLKDADDFVNIFDSAASKVNKNDGLPQCLCEICWTQTKTFHDFYKDVETAHRHHSLNFFGADRIKQERNGSSGYRTMEPSPQRQLSSKSDLIVTKYEGAEFVVEVGSLLIKEEEICDFDDEQNENIQDQKSDADQSAKKIGDNKVAESRVSSPDIECSNSSEEDCVDDNPENSNLESTNQCTKDEEDAQIREFCDMKCEICRDQNIQFETMREARVHYRQAHKISGYVTCCGNKFNRRVSALDHIKYHIDPDSYRCGQCDKRFACKRSLKAHMKNMHSTNSSEFKCRVCDKTFKTFGTLAYHERSKHIPENEKNVQCDKCDKKLPSKESLKMHIRSVHESKAQVCDICAQVFKSKPSLRNHMQSSHSATPPSKVQCNVCGVWLNFEVSLKRHMRRQHTEHNFSSSCPVCKKEFNCKIKMSSHVRRVHSDERPHQCTMCDKAFKSRKNLKEHIAIHTGEYLYNCQYCDKKFKSNANMYKHRKVAHFAEWRRDRSDRVPSKKTSTKISTDTD